MPKKNFGKIDDLSLRMMLNIILNVNFGTTSTFNNYLLQNDLIDEIYYSLTVEKDHVVVIFEVSSSYPEEVLNDIRKQMKKISISEVEFTRKKRALIATSILGYEDPYDVNSDIRMDLIRYNKITTDLKGIIESFSLKEIQDIASRITGYKESYIILNPIEENS